MYLFSVVSDSLPPPWTVACQAPLSMEFSRLGYWSGLPFPSPGKSSRPRDWTHVSWIGRWVLYHWHHLGCPIVDILHCYFQVYYIMIPYLYKLRNDGHSTPSWHPSIYIVTNSFFVCWELSRSTLFPTFKCTIQYY